MKFRTQLVIAPFLLTLVAAQFAAAQEESVTALITPKSNIEFGIHGATDKLETKGVYTGMSEHNALPILNGTYVDRDDETGTWTRLEGSDLGLYTRGLSFERERQGQWEYHLELDQTTMSNPLGISTSLSGDGSTVQLLSGTSRRELDLSVDRYNVEVGGGKRLTTNTSLNASFRSERKEGARQWGFRTTGSNLFFLTEPIDSWHHEANAELDYSGRRLQLTGGILGSFFRNAPDYVNQDAGNVSGDPRISLPLDNQAYWVYLDGGYSFTPATRGTLKISYNLATQDEDFFTDPTFPGNSRTDLGGEVHNTLIQFGLSSRLMPKLSARGKLRYEDRQAETPTSQFITANGTRTGFNETHSRTQKTADIQASYQLPMEFRLTGSIKYEHWDRSTPQLRQISWRDQNEEFIYGLALSRRLTETLGGAVSYSYADKDGGDFLPNGFGNNLIDPIHWGDRKRHKGALSLDWYPTDRLSLQAMFEGSVDAYDALELGPRDGRSSDASIDATYQLTYDWGLTAFVSRNEIFRDQATRNSSQSWAAELTQIGYSGGVGVSGTPREGLKIGVNLHNSYDKNQYELEGTDGSAIDDLPDIDYREFGFDAFIDRALSNSESVRIDYAYSHVTISEFAYDTFVYSDGTTIRFPERQAVHILGVSYSYRW